MKWELHGKMDIFCKTWWEDIAVSIKSEGKRSWHQITTSSGNVDLLIVACRKSV